MRQTEHRFLSTQELGSLLGVTRQTVRNWIKKGEIRAFHIGQNLKIPVQEAVRILMSFGLPVPDWLTQDHVSSWAYSTNEDHVKKGGSHRSSAPPDDRPSGIQTGISSTALADKDRRQHASDLK